MDTTPIVVDHVVGAPVGRVWDAITNPNQMRQWFFEQIRDFEPEVGFETEFVVQADGRDFRHLWTVTEVVPNQRITYRWRYDGYPGDSHVIWELAHVEGGTRVTFTHRGNETFPQDDPIFSREAGVAGWNYFVARRLPSFLEGLA